MTTQTIQEMQAEMAELYPQIHTKEDVLKKSASMAKATRYKELAASILETDLIALDAGELNLKLTETQQKLEEADAKLLELQQQHKDGTSPPAQDLVAMNANLIQELETLQAKTKIALKNKKPKHIPSPQEVRVKTDPQVLCTVQNIMDPGVSIIIFHGGVNFEIDDGSEALLPLCVMETLASIKQPRIVYDETAGPQQQMTKKGWNYRFSCTAVNQAQLADAQKKLNALNPDAAFQDTDMVAAPPLNESGD